MATEKLLTEESGERQKFIDDCNNALKENKTEHILNFNGWEIYNVDLNNKKYIKKYKKPFRYIKRKLNDNTNLPNLVAWAGISLLSFSNSSRIIMNNVEHLKDFYQAIYIISLDNIKSVHTDCFPCRDAKAKVSKNDHGVITYGEGDNQKTYNLEDKKENYAWRAFKNKDEISFQEDVSYVIDKIIRAIKLTNVHVLGKSAGAGIAIHIMDKSDIYTGLFLVVPSSPLNVQVLRELPKEKLESIKFRFMWMIEDASVFDWQKEEGKGEKSINEKIHYEGEMVDIKSKATGIDYKLYTYNGIEQGENETKSCKPGHHDIHKDFLKDMCT